MTVVPTGALVFDILFSDQVLDFCTFSTQYLALFLSIFSLLILGVFNNRLGAVGAGRGLTDYYRETNWAVHICQFMQSKRPVDADDDTVVTRSMLNVRRKDGFVKKKLKWQVDGEGVREGTSGRRGSEGREKLFWYSALKSAAATLMRVDSACCLVEEELGWEFIK